MLLLEKTIDLKINIGRKEDHGGIIIKMFTSLATTSWKENVNISFGTCPLIWQL